MSNKLSLRRRVFDRELLPEPAEYFEREGLRLIGRGAWVSALCPFHEDTHPSLRVNIQSGGFKCMACGTHGGDVLAFHMQRHALSFVDAVTAMRAWR